MERLIRAAGLALALAALVGCAGKTTRSPEKPRIGVYDSRAIAIAYVGSEHFIQFMTAFRAEHAQAKADGNHARMQEMEQEIVLRQKRLHEQGFSTAPVDDILAKIRDRLPAIIKGARVQRLVSKWDKAELSRHASAERVDVTPALIDALEPTEKQRKSALEIQLKEPISLEQAGKHQD